MEELKEKIRLHLRVIAIGNFDIRITKKNKVKLTPHSFNDSFGRNPEKHIKRLKKLTKEVENEFKDQLKT